MTAEDNLSSALIQEDDAIEQARLKIRPTSDVFISWLFTSEQFKHLTLSFINAVLEDAGRTFAKEIEIKNPFNVVECVTAKETILDLKVKDETGKLYDVEIQNQTTSAFLLRMAYYWAKLVWKPDSKRTEIRHVVAMYDHRIAE